jgi:hypothetical protein
MLIMWYLLGDNIDTINKAQKRNLCLLGGGGGRLLYGRQIKAEENSDLV